MMFREDKAIQSTRLLVLVFLITLPLLFVGGPDVNSGSSFLKALWNLGHVPFYTVLSLLLIRLMARKKITGARFIISAILLFALGSGLAIEYLQDCIGRQFSWADIAHNFVGACLALWIDPLIKKQLSTTGRKSFHAVVLLLLLSVSVKPATIFIDDLSAAVDFPLLADFSSHGHARRFEGSALMTIVDDTKLANKPLLNVEFLTGKYSTLRLSHPPADWRNFQSLSMRIYNPSKKPLILTCKIYDKAHTKRGYNYRDRYNQRLIIKPGWQQFTIPLEKIKNAPRLRTMELDNVVNVSLFSVNLSEPRTIYLDRIELRR